MGETALCILALNEGGKTMTFATFIYYFGAACFAVAVATLVFVAVDMVERKH